ncbi:MAG: hypothetical protein ACQESR_27835 [Planctomycetota bacterium]
MRARLLRVVFVLGFGLHIALLFIPAYHRDVAMLSAGARAFLESSLNTPVEQIFGATGNPQPLTPLDYYRLLFQLGRTGFGSFSVFVYSFKVLSYAASGVLVVLAFTTPTRRVFVSGGCSFRAVCYAHSCLFYSRYTSFLLRRTGKG